MIEICSLQRTNQTPTVFSFACEKGILNSGSFGKSNPLGHQRARCWVVFLTTYQWADSKIKDQNTEDLGGTILAAVSRDCNCAELVGQWPA